MKDIRKIIISDSTAYISTFSGLSIINVSNPDNLELLYTYKTKASYNMLHLKEKHLLYLSQENGLEVIDVSDKLNPIFVNKFDNDAFIYDIKFSKDKLRMYITDEFSFKILDLTNPKLPKIISTLYVDGLYKYIDITEDESLVFVANLYQGLQIYSIKQDNSIELLGGDASYVYSIDSVKLSPDDTKLYISNGNKGFEILDVSSLINHIKP